MKVLNLYAGLGGNRKLWQDVEVTAVENNEEIAAIYKEYFPNDTVIVGDAHQYLLDHHHEFGFIWTSRPCQTHSRARMWASAGGRYPAKYPDMTLYQEIIFMQHFVKCKWVAENVKPYYKPLIAPTAEIGRHLFWSNFHIPHFKVNGAVGPWGVTSSTESHGFSVKDRDIKHRKDQLIRNLVHPAVGYHVYESSKKEQTLKMFI